MASIPLEPKDGKKSMVTNENYSKMSAVNLSVAMAQLKREIETDDKWLWGHLGMPDHREANNVCYKRMMISIDLLREAQNEFDVLSAAGCFGNYGSALRS